MTGKRLRLQSPALQAFGHDHAAEQMPAAKALITAMKKGRLRP
jgi:hypothetical protein